MNNLTQIERIKIKLRLAKNTDPFFENFGSKSHQYQLNKPLSIEEVEKFENKYKITLPQCYKSFLTEIGNGGIEYQNSVVGNSGAGPYYGIFGLGHVYHFITDPTLKYLENEVYFNSKITEKEWFKNMPDHISDEDYDKEIAKAYSGILIIGFAGCSNFYGIILNGDDTGRVVHTYDEMQYCPHFVEQENFLDFYENWLDTIISGKNINGRISMSEKECIDRFLSDKEAYWKMVSLSYIRQIDSISEQNLKMLWEKMNLEIDSTVKMYLLNIFVKFDYYKSKTEINKLYLKKPMDFLRILHLYSPEKTIEWMDIIQDIKQALSSGSEIIEYIKYVTTKDLC
jgi:hypothetical protein